ncbi:M3 family metallopeptidase [Opitutus sp. GAS368]|uniref:M3 family metallopeptidase n=1 Tax=Opitutus sp. GAS368 TaxID=1882749 RepID=UPI0031B5C842
MAAPLTLHAQSDVNPLLTESPLPFHYPQFDKIRNEHYGPAFELGMAEHLKEVGTIANNPAKPTFENTIVALEKAGQLLDRVSTIFFALSGSNTNPEMQKLQRELAPRLAAHRDAITLNPVLFARIDALYGARDTLGLDAESARLLWRYHRDFVRAGAKLPAADKEKLKLLNGELASLTTAFTQNTLKEVAASAVTVDTKEELAGLTDDEIAAAAALAAKDGHAGKFDIRLVNTSGQPPLTNLTNRATREKVMAASLARGSRGGEFDTRAIVTGIAKKRAERATLLGAPTFADYSLAEQTAGSVAVVNRLLAQLGPPAVANARREAADMQAIIDAEQGGFQLAAGDWQLYAEKVRKAKYDFDETQLKPYYELNHVILDGVFYAAHLEYGLSFKERHDLPVYEPSVRVFDVFDADGRQLAIFIGDYYARSNKNGGAWMNSYVSQSGLLGDLPVVANHLNIPKPPEGQPTLLTHDEVKTAFHEFGHALHGMFSQVQYPRFSGTSVPRDFVEYPSQVNEMWAVWPEVLKNYAKHYQTGAPIPQALLDKVEATKKFNQGHDTLELVAANVIDQAWHQLRPDQVPAADDVVAFETAALHKAGLDFAPVPPRYRSAYYSHSMGGYAAGYYSYFWSEVLDADTVEWFKTHGGLTRANGDRFRKLLLSRGGSEDALKLFRDMTGGDPDIKPLLVRRGLDTAK